MQETKPIYEIIFKGKVPMVAINTGKNRACKDCYRKC